MTSVIIQRRLSVLAALLGLAVFFWCPVVRAQFQVEDLVPDEDEESTEAAPTEAQPGPNAELTVEQQQIADKFRHFEEVLLRMAELSAGTDPRRAALLRKAVAQSKDRLISVQFESLVALLEKDQLSRAIENQDAVNVDLKTLLELLLSEDRGRRIESEKARMREYLKRVNEIIKQQKGIQGRTAGQGETKRLSEEQGNLAQKTGNLAEDIKANEEKAKDSQGQNGEQAESGDQKGQEGKPSESGEKQDGEKGDKAGAKEQKDGEEGSQGGAKTEAEGKEQGEGKSGEKSEAKEGQSESSPKSPGESSEKMEGEGKSPSDGEGQKQSGQKSQKSQSQGQPQSQGQGQSQGQESEQSDSPAAEQENPARKRLENARQRMREAEDKLKEAERKGAVDKQEEAIRELEQAKADLEEILRQLREEEIGRMLALLETRFRKMLQMQREVYDGTVRLDKVPQADRAHSHDIEAGRLSGKEADIVLEVDRALALMREDGTAVAFPEAVEQMREDMEQVVQRLSQAKVDRMTQGIEEDIIAALEEMIDALQKAQQDLEQRQQQGQPQQGEPQDPPLVDILSELKMIRALQMRVNSRTERYSKLVEGEQATSDDLIEALEKLAERQERIFRITRDLQRERNR